ncbi:MAG TPA: SAM-dependent methyltransferase, partial [Allocoleopsis sp.]
MKDERPSLPLRVIVIIGVLLISLMLLGYRTLLASAVAEPEGTYQERVVHSPDGIGKFYMSREIAKVMGHTEALWLERPSRVATEQPQQALAALD